MISGTKNCRIQPQTVQKCGPKGKNVHGATLSMSQKSALLDCNTSHSRASCMLCKHPREQVMHWTEAFGCVVGQTCIFGVGSTSLFSSMSSGNVSSYMEGDLVTSPRVQAAVLCTHRQKSSGRVEFICSCCCQSLCIHLHQARSGLTSSCQKKKSSGVCSC